MKKQKMIVVTGATGFIGSNLLYALEVKGYTNIVGIDYFGSGEKWKNVAKRSFVHFVLPDQMQAFLETNKENITAIIHLGGISSTTETDVDEIVKTNIQLTLKLYVYCKKNNLQFIYASSAATYGSARNDRERFEDFQDIKSLGVLRPMNAYGWSKNCIDKYIAANTENFSDKSQVVGLKFFNVFGPNEYHKGDQMSVIAKFYHQYLTTGKVKLFKVDNCSRLSDKQNPQRDFVYVDDCVDVIIWMLEHKTVSGLFNVGTGEANTFENVAYYVAKYIEKESKIEYIDMPDSLREQYQYYTCANIEKLRCVGYMNKMTCLKDGIKLYINHYLSRTDKYK